MKNWLVGRISEPSTWAAVGVCVIALGVLLNSWYLPVLAIIVGIAAFILKENGWTDK
tara:strand:+ start:895 stop:1065 length:171 start_codon:yes stop_codon:yes gene_type:complete